MVPKFRAWDETQHKMLQVDYIEFIDGKAYWVEASPADGNVQGGNDGPIGDNNQLKLEQFTGLKDANGKEIYEGDILLYQEDYGDGFFAPVIYGSENLYYPAFDLDWHYIPKSYFFESNAISEGVANDRLIVAGNIHTNLELLEAQHD